MTIECPPAAVALAGRLADAAGDVIRPLFRQPIDVDDKADQSPVTAADRGAEEVMRRMIGDAFPDHGIEGEEYGIARPDAPWRWVLDPVDGTKSFVSGSPMFGTLIGLAHRGAPALGVIDQPVLRERWLAHGDQRTPLNGRPVAVRPCGSPDRAVVYGSTPDILGEGRLRVMHTFMQRSRFVRFCGDCYAFAMLATGFVDLVVEADLKPHDYTALIPVVRNAGGIVTDWTGHPGPFAGEASLVAAGDARVHAAALEILNA